MMALPPRIFQWLFVSSCFICLGVRATDVNILSVKDRDGNTVKVKYEAIGCYRDDTQSRSLRNLYFNARELITWSPEPNFTNTIHACVKNGYEEGYTTIFGIQYYGECWSDGSAESRYMKYGVSSNCEHGVGKDLANMVYRISKVVNTPVSQTCTINGKEYSEGAEMLIPNDWSSGLFDPKCMKCVCSGGLAKDCQIYAFCESGQQGLCSRWKNATGQCCPVCDCYHDGKVMEAGSTWIVRKEPLCSSCTCGDNNIASCTNQLGCVCNVGYVAIPDPEKCCPKCVPQATTTTAAPTPEIIPITTERPPPTFPPFPMP